MKLNTLMMPCCYFPTQVAMVDDNEILTQSLKLHIESRLLVFNDALKALDYFSHYKPAAAEDIWLQPDYESDIADGSYIQPMSINTENICSLQYDPNKYQDISVLIMDYHMPELNGLELLKKMSHKPFKTILLTGDGDHALAVQAFNQGQIDYFLRKDEDNLGKKLNLLIKKLQFEYFCEMSCKSREMISKDNPIFSNEEMSSHFYEIIQQNKVKEFYLINLYGNYLFVDFKNQKHYFCAYTQEQLNLFADNAAEDEAYPEIINSLLHGKQIPFFGETTPYWKIEGKRWGEFMFNPTIIRTQNGNVYVGITQ